MYLNFWNERLRNSQTDWWTYIWIKGPTEEKRKNAECAFFFNDGSGIWGNNVCWEMLALWRVRGGWEFIKASATNRCRDGGSRQPCVCTQTHVYAHWFDSCVWTEHRCPWPSLLRSTLALAAIMNAPKEVHIFSSDFSLPLLDQCKHKWLPLLPLSGESSFIKSQMKPDHISCGSWVTR